MRQDNDFYRTHELLTIGMLQHPVFRAALGDGRKANRPLDKGGETWFEPCAGDLAIARTVQQQTGVYMTTNDIDASRDVAYCMDAADRHIWGMVQPDWTITNPPYVLAPDILHHAVKHSKKGVIALLRLSFAEPCQNRQWLQHYPPTFLLVAGDPRPAFRLSDNGKHQTDNVTTAWFLWQKGKPPCMDFMTNNSMKWGTPAPADNCQLDIPF